MICPKCNSLINDNIAVCPVCGTEVAVNNGYNNQNANYTVPNTPYGNNYRYQQNVPPQQKKRKSRKGVIFLIIGIYIVLIVAVVVAILLMRNNSDEKDKRNNNDTVVIPPHTDVIEVKPETETEIEFESDEAEAETENEAEPEMEFEADTEEVTEEEAAEEEGVAEEEEPEVITEPEPVAEPPVNKRLVIATGGLNLRARPDTNSASRGIIADGSIITIESEFDGWAYTCYGGTYGWCSAEFLFVPTEYSYPILYSAKVTARSGVELDIPDHKVGTRNAKTTIPYEHVVYVYKQDGNRVFVSYNSIYGWCYTYDLQRRY